MNYVYIGIIVNTHGLKGEVRIISDFDKKESVFKINNKLYIGDNYQEETINSYRKHKNYDMVTFLGIDYINDVLKYKSKKVYFKREDLNLKTEEYLESDLINMEAFFNQICIGKVIDIIDNNGYKLLNINDKLIPYNSNFIENVDLNQHKINLKNVEDLI